MNYSMTEPCDECPYLRTSGFTHASLMRHAIGEFACHKTCNLDEEDGTYNPHRKSLHCAGALIFLMKRGESTQMMRICERIGHWDPSKMNMDANVGSKPADYRRGRS